jgi:hypothetical protein
MNEKPFRLELGFNEALQRLAKVPKKHRHGQSVDYKAGDSKNKNGAVKKPRRSAGKSDPAD